MSVLDDERRCSMSKPITVRGHTDKNGSLKLNVATDVREADVEVVVVVNPLPPGNGGGWPEGFLEKAYGSLADSGLARPDQGEHESRDAVE
jgi:hypothetical protein